MAATKDSDDETVTTFSPKRPRIDTEDTLSLRRFPQEDVHTFGNCPDQLLDGKSLDHCLNNNGLVCSKLGNEEGPRHHHHHYHHYRRHHNSERKEEGEERRESAVVSVVERMSGEDGKESQHHHHQEQQQASQQCTDVWSGSSSAHVGVERLQQEQQQHDLLATAAVVATDQEEEATKQDENMPQITAAENEMETRSLSSDPLHNPDIDNANADNLDNVSEISDLSALDEDAWRPVSGPLNWVQRQMTMGRDPRLLFREMISPNTFIPPDLDEMTLWGLLVNFISEPPKRQKLNHINTIDDVVHLLKTSRKIMVLTGAGVSVSCGIPDFRSRNGIYARLAVDFPDLPDPQAMFDINYFRNDPRPFFKFAKEIYPGQFEPSKCHKFIKLIEDHDRLLHNYTQNIDTLEQQAGIEKVVQCHGSFATATCMKCFNKLSAESIREDIFKQVTPRCERCPPECTNAIMKPDIVFFGENLPEHFHYQMAEDKEQCDLLIVIGSSMKVRPVALIPNYIPAHVPQILINREPLKHMTFDVELLGDGDVIVNDLCKRLGDSWKEAFCDPGPPFTQIRKDQLETPPLSPEPKEDMKKLHNNLSSSVFKKNDLNKTENEVVSSSITNKDILNDPKSIVLKENKTGQNSSSVENDMQCVPHSSENDVKMSTEFDSIRPVTKSTCEENDDQNISGENGDNIDFMKFFWKKSDKAPKQSLGKQLKENQMLFLPPCQYAYPGAEIYSEDEEEMVYESESPISESSSSWESFSDEDESGKKVTKNGFDNPEALALNSVAAIVDLPPDNKLPFGDVNSSVTDLSLAALGGSMATTTLKLSTNLIDPCTVNDCSKNPSKEHYQNQQLNLLQDISSKQSFVRFSESKQNGYAGDNETVENRLASASQINTQHNQAASLAEDNTHHIWTEKLSNSPLPYTSTTAKSHTEVDSIQQHTVDINNEHKA